MKTYKTLTGWGATSALMLAFVMTGCVSDSIEPNTSDMDDMGSTTPVDKDQGMENPNPVIDQGNTEPEPEPEPVCNGCLSSTGACLSGTTNQACGSGGTACVACDATQGEYCGESECVPPPPCNADNCNGCCQDNTCIEVTSDSSCGIGGIECQDCTVAGGTCGDNNTCKPACGPETCEGCCDASGECVSGDTDAVCGKGGQACGACGAEEECEVTSTEGAAIAAGQCVDVGCSATCEGCCDGDTCLTGDLGEACGTAGAQCQDCGDGAFCTDLQVCMPKSDARFNLVLLQGVFPEKTVDGDDWDGIIGTLPDPFVRAYYTDLATGDEVSKKSSEVDGTTTPVWNEVLFEGLSAEDLRSDLKFDYIEDDVTFNDTLAEGCAFDDINILFDEQPHVLICGQEKDANGVVTYEGGQFSVQLERVTTTP